MPVNTQNAAGANAPTRPKAIINLVLFFAFALSAAPQATGVAFHEWVSLAVLPPLLLHLLIDWSWIVNVTARMFRRMPGELRFNLIWNWLLFVNMVAVTVSGLLISEAAAPAVGLPVQSDVFWAALHDVTANTMLAMLGVHIAMHWRWIGRALRGMWSVEERK